MEVIERTVQGRWPEPTQAELRKRAIKYLQEKPNRTPDDEENLALLLKSEAAASQATPAVTTPKAPVKPAATTPPPVAKPAVKPVAGSVIPHAAPVNPRTGGAPPTAKSNPSLEAEKRAAMLGMHTVGTTPEDQKKLMDKVYSDEGVKDKDETVDKTVGEPVVEPDNKKGESKPKEQSDSKKEPAKEQSDSKKEPAKDDNKKDESKPKEKDRYEKDDDTLKHAMGRRRW